MATSEEDNLQQQNVEESISRKCGQHCSRGTTKENYYALNTAVNSFLMTLVILFFGCLVSFAWIFILAFTGIRTIELSYMIVLFVLQLLVGAVHGVLLKRKTSVYCMIAMVMNVAMTIFLVVLITIVIIKNGFVINPQVRTLPITIALTLAHVFAFFCDFNLIRFLHSYQKHWIGTKIIGQHSLHFSETNVHQASENYVAAGPAIDDYDLIEIVSDESLSSENDENNNNQAPSNQVSFDEDDRQQAGKESRDDLDESYPEEMNPFAGEIEVIVPEKIASLKDDSTQGFTDEKFEVSSSSDSDEPRSEYLIDVLHKLPQYPISVDLPMQEIPLKEQIPTKQRQQRRRSRDKRPMQYMAHFHKWSHQNHIMLPDGTFVTPCPWDPHQNITDETSAPRILHPNSSVIIEKSSVPVPEYLERADFISLLPNTKV